MPAAPKKSKTISSDSVSVVQEELQIQSLAKEEKKYKFLLKRGRHQEGDDNRLYSPDEVIETDNDLRKHNSSGSPRFVLVGVATGEEIPPAELDSSSDGLENLKLEELVQYAKEGDVDISGVEDNQAEIISRIRSSNEESN